MMKQSLTTPPVFVVSSPRVFFCQGRIEESKACWESPPDKTMKNSLEHLLISSVLVLCLLFTLTKGNSHAQNSIIQLSKLFSNLQDIHDAKQTQEENTKDQVRSDTRKQRGEIGLILALGAPVHVESLQHNDKDTQTDTDKRAWDVDFEDDQQDVEKRQGAWDYDYGLGGGRFGKRFDYNFGGGRWGRDVDHVKQGQAK
uniref:Uncharacterized protein n=1 Tax=Magallana gigas TaxID=29159 RepID=A0A8W8L3A7_MAGGI